ncbi:hypothetical protein ACOKM5_04170 [Streptomyces sp. BH097]|uniref:hypothetical protein n=1 Tax=unclassified Streptomyces TaxID=2593676 RepID=UPI003BB7BA47
MKSDLHSRLVELDAAPRAELSTAELARKEQLLVTVLSDTGRPGDTGATGFRRPLVRRLACTTAAGLAAGAALLAVTLSAEPSTPGGSGPLSSAEVATWTSTAHRPNRALSSFGWCFHKAMEANGGVRGMGTITNADRRGTTTSMIVTSRYHSAYCLAGPEGPGVAVPITSDTEDGVSANDVTLDARGTLGDGPARFRYMVGLVGEDVKEITVRDQGRTIHATLQQEPSLPWGRWTAWWPESDSHDGPVGTVTLTLKDGTTRTVEGL